MNAQKILAAVAVFVAAGSAVAADAPVTDAAASAAAATSATSVVVAPAQAVPSVSITQAAERSRAEVHAEAVEFVKNHKTALAIQLEQYKN